MSEQDSQEEVKKPKRAPRKRVAKKTTSTAAAKPRKRAVKKVAKKAPVKRAVATDTVEKTAEEPVVPEVSNRKAPTSFASEKQRQKQRQKHMIIIGLILVVGIGASAAVGFTDQGQINVTQVIEERNQRVVSGNTDTRDRDSDTVAVPVQNTNKAANGGLVGLGTGGAKPTPPVETASTTASTTDATASSTDEVATSTTESTETASSTLDTPEESNDEPTAPEAATSTATSS